MGRVYLEQQRVNVGVIEKLTGLTFFGGLPAESRAALSNHCERSPLWPAPAPPNKKKKPG
jgi:hypothetical protein